MALIDEGIYQFTDTEGFPQYVVQGHSATLPEYNVAIALHRLGYDFVYQAQFNGGRGSPGGIEVDFLVYTVPWYTPVWVHGEFWHGGTQRDRDIMQMTRLDQLMGGKVAPGVEVFEDDVTPEPEDAVRKIREVLL